LNATVTSLPFSAVALALAGITLMGLGLYFVLLRPPLLPEDLRYMGVSLAEIQVHVPRLLLWLRRVMWVIGGYAIATGLLTIYVAVTTFRARAKGAASVIAVAGITSIGWMAYVNFIIDSDFKWLILVFVLPWILALALYYAESSSNHLSRA
jgi:hypothetical protein